MNKEDLWKLHSSIADWIKVADSKALFVMAVIPILATFLGFFIKTKNVDLLENEFALTFLLTLVCYTLISIIASIVVLFPRLKTIHNKNNSPLFFMDIATFTTNSSFLTYIKGNIKVEEELISQIHINSTIAKSKFLFLQWSLAFLGFGIIAAVIFILLAI
jgi:hypothetical protein